MNKFDKKYKAIACELVEQLCKNGLTVEESIWTLKIATGAYESVAAVKVPTPQELCNLLK